MQNEIHISFRKLVVTFFFFSASNFRIPVRALTYSGEGNLINLRSLQGKTLIMVGVYCRCIFAWAPFFSRNKWVFFSASTEWDFFSRAVWLIDQMLHLEGRGLQACCSVITGLLSTIIALLYGANGLKTVGFHF